MNVEQALQKAVDEIPLREAVGLLGKRVEDRWSWVFDKIEVYGGLADRLLRKVVAQRVQKEGGDCLCWESAHLEPAPRPPGRDIPGKTCGRCGGRVSWRQDCGFCGRGIYRVGGWNTPNRCVGCGKFSVPWPEIWRVYHPICQCLPIPGFKPRRKRP